LAESPKHQRAQIWRRRGEQAGDREQERDHTITRLRPTSVGEPSREWRGQRYADTACSHRHANRYLRSVKDIREQRQQRLRGIELKKRAESG
jgi:hypothetical protein